MVYINDVPMNAEIDNDSIPTFPSAVISPSMRAKYLVEVGEYHESGSNELMTIFEKSGKKPLVMTNGGTLLQAEKLSDGNINDLPIFYIKDIDVAVYVEHGGEVCPLDKRTYESIIVERATRVIGNAADSPRLSRGNLRAGLDDVPKSPDNMYGDLLKRYRSGEFKPVPITR